MSEQSQFVKVVGIGASAGGIDETRTLLGLLHDDVDAAFVILQHLPPDMDSQLAELHGKSCCLPVREAEDSCVVEAGHVYTCPPGVMLELEEGRLVYRQLEKDKGAIITADTFFRSLARELGDLAVGIVLSGTAEDGTQGLRAIQQAGGLAIVQQPAEAQQAGMPRHAAEHAHVDLVLPIKAIAKVLQQHLRDLDDLHGQANPQPSAEEELESILALLHIRSGEDFRRYKRTTLRRRLFRRMRIRGYNNPADYRQELRQEPDELAALRHELLIGVTSFFRDPDAWDALKELALMPMIRRCKEEQREQLRVWIPGCSEGREVYTMLMLLQETCDQLEHSITPHIFATDLDAAALDVARAGIYPDSIADDVGAERLERFFERGGDGWQVHRELRQLVTFARQNVLSDSPFSRMDLISCRNLLIYLQPDAQRRLFETFHFALKDDGILFLGNAESTGRNKELFQPLSRKWRVFRKNPDTEPARVHLPDRNSTQHEPDPPPTSGNVTSDRPVQLLEGALLKHYAPSAALIDKSAHILYLHGELEDFLMFQPGEPTYNLLTLVRQGLRSKLRSAIREASSNRSPITFTAHARLKDNAQPTRVTILPLKQRELYAVTFEQQGPPVRDLPEAQEADATLVRQLEEELLQTRDELQRTIEKLKAANEELKASNEEVTSMNEELQAANEELEVSKEELQSTNEELVTVNDQLEEKVSAYEEANNDLDNLITSTEIATLFLDSRLHLKRYTPSTKRLVNLIPGDIGRPISDLATRACNDYLLEDAQEVLKSLQPITREVQDEEGAWYVRRARPYRTQRNTIEGVVITFVDVNDLKKAQQSEQRRAAEMSALLSSVPVAVYIAHDPQCQRITANQVGRSILNLPTANPEDTLHEPLEDLLGEFTVSANGEELPRDRTPLRQSAATGEAVGPLELDVTDTRGRRRTLFGSAHPIRNEEGSVTGAVAAFVDISKYRKTREELKASEERMRLAARAAAEAIWEYDVQQEQLRVTPTYERMLGKPDSDGAPWSWWQAKLHPEDSERVVSSLRATLDDGSEAWTAEYRLQSADGEWLYVVDRAFIARDASGVATRLVGAMLDISERVKAQQHLQELNQELETRIELRTADLKQKAEQLQALTVQLAETEQTERRRLAKILHDHLQQLLVAARYRLNVAMNENLQESAREALDEINTLIAEALAIGRDLTLELSPPVLYDGGLSAALRWLAEHLLKIHDLHVDIDSNLPNQCLNEQHRVLAFDCIRELLLNIIKHSGKKCAQLLLKELPEEGQLRVRVQDHGEGFDPEAIRQRPGHFGLFHIRQRMDAIGGSMTIESAPGSGTCVELLLPMEPSLIVEKQGAAEPARIDWQRPADEIIRVLLVDDHMIVRQGVRQMLELECDILVVGEAENGREGLRMARDLRPQVILMDINMPEMDGIEATRLVTQQFPEIIVIGLSLYEDAKMQQTMCDAGASICLSKSKAADDVCETVRRLVSES